MPPTMLAMTMAVIAWLGSRVRSGSQETCQPPPAAVAVCGVSGLLMWVSVIVMPPTAHTVSGSEAVWYLGWSMRHPARCMSSRTAGSLT